MAILVIMLSHYISSIAHLGIGAGNTIFLVLSGFLAMYTWRPLQEPIWIQMGGRYLQRMRKFYGSFLVATILAVPLSLHMLNDALVIPKVIVNLLLLQSWIPDYSGYGWITFAMPCWFLCTYLFCEGMVPVLAPLAIKLRDRHLTVLGLAVPGIILMAVNMTCVWQISTYFPLVRLNDFFIGMMACNIATDARHQNDALYDAIGYAAFCLMIVAMICDPFIPEILSRNVLWSVLAAALMIGLYHAEKCHKGWLYMTFTNAPIIGIGAISMELFLFHTQIGNYLHVIDNRVFGGGHESVTCIIALLLSIGFCTIYQRYCMTHSKCCTRKM